MVRAYANGKIYCIRNRAAGDGIVYIGSTVQPLCERMRGHRGNIKDTPERPLYKLMNEVGVEHFHIELVTTFPCESKAELEREEGRHIRMHRPMGNAVIAGRTKQEWYVDNREEVLVRQREYREANLEAIMAREKLQSVANREAVAAYNTEYHRANRAANLARMKEYATANGEAIAERKKEYVAAHREAIAAGQRAHYTAHCEAKKAYAKAYRERKKAERVAVQGPNVENVTN